MRKLLLLANIALIMMAVSCKEDTPLPENPVFSYSLTDINSTNGYQMTFNISNYNADLNYLYVWNLGMGKYISSSGNEYNQVYSKSGSINCYFKTKGVYNIQLTATNENGETTNTTTINVKSTDTIANFNGTVTSQTNITSCSFFAKPYNNTSSSYSEIYSCTGNNLSSLNYNFTLSLSNLTAIAPIYGKQYQIYVHAYYANSNYYHYYSDPVIITLGATNKVNFAAQHQY